jgi:hypothetical protein
MLLLLLAGSLRAQNQCSIHDLTATANFVSFSPCEYYVVLDFEHSGTTTQFTVQGNGVNYGTFSYDSLPVKIGPFTAGTAPTTLEFVVTDVEYQDCQDVVEIQTPVCPQNTCDIYELMAQVGDCNPDGLTYQLSLDFKVTNPGNDFFEVWAGNGTYLGIYPISALPLKIPAFPWSGDPTDLIKICINDNPNCCETLQFDAPDCSNTACNINNLSVSRGDCTSDSTYSVEVNFNLLTSAFVAKFGLWANDEFLGFYGFDDLPLKIDSFPWDGGPTDFVKICVVDVTLDPQNPQIVCCKTLEFAVPDCLPIYPCGVQDLTVETDSCSSDSTFGVWVNFTVNDTSAVDSFQLWGNGHDLGVFAFDSLPLYLPDFPWNNGIFSYLKVCTGNTATCCKELQFLAPACLPFDSCEVTDIFIQTGDCTSDSTYKVKLNFQATNPGNGTFSVWANGELFGTFPIDTVPLTLDSFTWSGNDVDVVKLCVNSDSTNAAPCCREEEFDVPACITGDTCAITNVSVDPGDCNPGGQTYSLYLNFEVANPGNDFFELWTGSGIYLGNFPLSDLPIQIPAFPCNNSGVGVLRICVNDNPDCCTVVEFQAPNCCGGTGGPCEIEDLTVETGDCTGNDTYEVWVNFDVTNPLSDEFGVWANGEFLGNFPLDSLPLHIPDFPWNGGQNDVVKICFTNDNGAIGCCKTKEFPVPDCLDQQCEIYNLTVETGDCNSDSSYQVVIDFDVANPPSDSFSLWANGQLFGTFHLDSLPLHIDSFPWDGGPNDVVKVCFTNSNDPNAPGTCCRTKEFHVPDCLKCEIYDLVVETGDCTSDSTYEVWVNFQVVNPPYDTFGVWANGEFLGYFHVDSLPLYIPDFQWNGGSKDVVKVCFATANIVSCCNTKEFFVPDCLDDDDDCEIDDLTVETGDCTSDSTYTVTINFDANNPPGNTFGLWVNGVFYDTFSLDSLPLTIEDFPWDGGPNDVVKVCLTNSGAVGCCKTKEFAVPDCLDAGGPCHISDLTIDTGDCTSDSTYTVTINFDVSNPPADSFGLWGNGEFLGNFSLDSLPLTIEDFLWNGGQNDVIKVCFANTGAVGCCKTEDFAVPDCLDPGGDCEIDDLTVETGDCTSDDTYEVWINFEVSNPPADSFGVWANGEFLGLFPLDSLPLYISDFPWDGGNKDVVKICFPSSNSSVTCCATKEFHVPNCCDPNLCQISDVHVVTTPCLCGQFFALVTFEHSNGGAEGFDIVGNGNNYGNFPYNYPQPIILGPFPGDDATDYEFAVVDHLNQNCADDFHLGTVDCVVAVNNPGDNARLTLSPNPTTSWLNVTAQLQSGISFGESNVEIYHADGRLVRNRTVADGSNFLLDVSDLPAGVYRLVLIASAGRVEGTFAKQ